MNAWVAIHDISIERSRKEVEPPIRETESGARTVVQSGVMYNPKWQAFIVEGPILEHTHSSPGLGTMVGPEAVSIPSNLNSKAKQDGSSHVDIFCI
jgi:hypothetical protein